MPRCWGLHNGSMDLLVQLGRKYTVIGFRTTATINIVVMTDGPFRGMRIYLGPITQVYPLAIIY